MKKLVTILLVFCIIRCGTDPLTERKAEDCSGLLLSKVENPQDGGRTNANITYPHGNEIFNSGDQVNIDWSFCVCGGDWASPYVNVDLYQGNQYINTIATNQPFTVNLTGNGSYNWTIPSYIEGNYNGLFRIKITATNNSSNFAFSEEFTINPSGIGKSFSNPISMGSIGSCTYKNDIKRNAYAYFVNSYGGGGADIYYKFILTTNSITHLANCQEHYAFRLYLFDSNLNLLETGTIGDCDNGSRIDRSLPAGAYYYISSEPDSGYDGLPNPQIITALWTDC